MTASDIERANAFLAGLMGKTCWRVGETYGDQLTLEIGGRRKLRRSKDREHGEWHIESQTSDWSAVQSGKDGLLASSSDPIKQAVRALKVVEQATVASATVSESLSLRVTFANGIEVEFRPPSPAEDTDYWNVFGPDNLILIAGPGTRCEVLRSDVPIRDQK